MKAVFEYIKQAINTRIKTIRQGNEQPFFRKVDLWRGQITREQIDKDEDPYNTPAVFIELVPTQVDNFSLGIKNIHLTVRFHMALQSMKKSRGDDFDILDAFDQAIQGLRAGPTATVLINSVPVPVNFSSMQKQIYQGDPDHDNVNAPIVEYFTIYREINANKTKTDQFVGPIDPDVIGQVVENITP